MRLDRRCLPLVALAAAACGGGTGPVAPLEPNRTLVTAPAEPLVAGEANQFSVTRTGADTGPVTFRSSDSTIARIDADGRVWPLRTGRVILSAQIGTVSGADTLDITARADSFRVRFVYQWDATATERKVFEQAAMRWHRALRASTAWSTTLPDGACLAGLVGGAVSQQGAVVYVDRFDDGSVAPDVQGTAGPCLTDAQGRTRIGVVTVRRSRLDALATADTAGLAAAETFAAHQLGQTLGLAGLTTFGVARPELDTTRTGDARWTGSAAVAAYTARGGSLGAVPLTNDLGHWRADAGTAGDLLLPTVTASLRITALSLGALADRGYMVDQTKSEAPAATAVASFVAGGTSTVWRSLPWRPRPATAGRIALR